MDTYQGKYPKAAECLQKDREALLAFYYFPAEHWMHLRTPSSIESAFAAICHRTDLAKGCLSRGTKLSMTFKLACTAEKSFRRLRRVSHLAKVIAAVPFVDDLENNAGPELRRAAARTCLHTPFHFISALLRALDCAKTALRSNRCGRYWQISIKPSSISCARRFEIVVLTSYSYAAVTCTPRVFRITDEQLSPDTGGASHNLRNTAGYCQ